MKNNQASQTVEGKQNAAPFSSRSQPSTLNSQRGFTLIELLVVIAIIGILSAFIIPALKSFKRAAVINQTKAEMSQLITAIDGFKAAYGFYPPSNKNYNPANSTTFDQVYFSPLYFELLGTTNDNPSLPNNGTYHTLNNSASILASALLPATASPLGVGGFANCMKPNVNSEDAPVARSFITDLKTKQYWIGVTNGAHPQQPVSLLIASVGGPDDSYQPLNTAGLNPWRYVCPGINNPNSYDLWIQLKIGGKTNLICNWNKQVTFNSPLP